MNTIAVADGTQIFYKDWGTGQPIVFHHGWPLSADDWDAQMLFVPSMSVTPPVAVAAAQLFSGHELPKR